MSKAYMKNPVLNNDMLPVDIVLAPEWWYEHTGICFDRDFFFGCIPLSTFWRLGIEQNQRPKNPYFWLGSSSARHILAFIHPEFELVCHPDQDFSRCGLFPLYLGRLADRCLEGLGEGESVCHRCRIHWFYDSPSVRSLSE